MVDANILITVAVLLLAIILFVTEWIPASITALSAAAALMLTGVVDVETGLSGFSNEATITVLCMLVIAAAINRSGLVLILAHKILDIAAGSKMRFLFLLMVFAAGTSAFLANTPIVAMLIPLVMTVAARLKASASRFLIPMAYATTLGGMITLVGTSTNVLASSISAKMGYGAFGFFEFAHVGLIVTVVGLLYLFFIGYRLLPTRHVAGQLEEQYDYKAYLSEIVVKPNSPLIGQTVESSNLKVRYEIDFVRIIRGGTVFDQPLIGFKLEPGDILLVRASHDEILKVRDDQGVDLLPEVTHWSPADKSELRLAQVIIAPGAAIAGGTLSSIRFRNRYDAAVLAVKKRERFFVRRLNTMKLEPGDTLLISAPQAAIDRFRSDLGFIVTDERDANQYRREKIPIVLGIFLGVILAASLEVMPLPVAALTGVILLVVTGSLHLDEFQQAVPWHLIFLLAGLIPLGVALLESGTADLAAGYLYTAVQNWPPFAILGAVYLVTLLLTEMMSNNASVAIMIPLGVELATDLGLNAFPFILAATFGASLAFMAPIGYQTYLMVYGPGEYRFRDFVRVGAPLNLICMIVSVALLNLFWPLTPA